MTAAVIAVLIAAVVIGKALFARSDASTARRFKESGGNPYIARRI